MCVILSTLLSTFLVSGQANPSSHFYSTHDTHLDNVCNVDARTTRLARAASPVLVTPSGLTGAMPAIQRDVLRSRNVPTVRLVGPPERRQLAPVVVLDRPRALGHAPESRHRRRCAWRRVLRLQVHPFPPYASLVLTARSLEQVPETGRWRFIDVSPAFETRMAKEQLANLQQELGPRILPASHPLTKHVTRVVERILSANNLGSLAHASAAPAPASWSADPWGDDGGIAPGTAAGTEGREWHLLVVDDPKTVNAFASFGTIAVFTGILPVAKDEEGLAAVLAHGTYPSPASSTSLGTDSASCRDWARHRATQLGEGLAGKNRARGRVAAQPRDRRRPRPLENAEHVPDGAPGRPPRRARGGRDWAAPHEPCVLPARGCARVRASTRMFGIVILTTPRMFTRMGEMEGGKRANVNFLYTHPTSETRVKVCHPSLSMMPHLTRLVVGASGAPPRRARHPRGL
jgi:hypothetical protein